jgi:hypothetical protein
VSAAIEQMVVNQIAAAATPGAKPVVAPWDQCVFQPRTTSYPTVAGIVNNTTQLMSGWSVDWASANPGTIVAICQGVLDPKEGAGSGYSSDGGSTWSKFATEVSDNGGDMHGYISGTTLTITSITNGVVDVSHLPEAISGPGVTSGTLITAAGTGMGGSGTYTVNHSQTVGSAGSPIALAIAPGGVFGGCIAASSSTNILQVQATGFAASGFPIWYTTDGGLTWHNPDSSLNTITSTWHGPYYDNFRGCAADRVTANTFYLYNISVNGSGSDAVYISTNGGETWTQQCRKCAGSQGFGGPYGITAGMKTAPGLAGYLAFSTGGAPANNTSLHNFWLSTNAAVSWTAPSNVENVIAFGFGAVKPGNTGCGGGGCPSIYLAGEANPGSGFSYAFWRSDDWGNSWTTVGSLYPLGDFAQISDIEGDKNTWGTFYIAMHGSGCYYGKLGVLLRPDLDPEPNDNVLIWVTEAA